MFPTTSIPVFRISVVIPFVIAVTSKISPKHGFAQKPLQHKERQKLQLRLTGRGALSSSARLS
jgi:hypothetical protein